MKPSEGIYFDLVCFQRAVIYLVNSGKILQNEWLGLRTYTRNHKQIKIHTGANPGYLKQMYFTYLGNYSETERDKDSITFLHPEWKNFAAIVKVLKCKHNRHKCSCL